MVLLIELSIKNVPTFPGEDDTEQGNRQMPKPNMPERVRVMSSILSYPLYEISKIDAEPRIIINTVQAFVYQVAEMESGI